MTGRERLAVAGALLLGAAVAFPAGMMFGGQERGDEPTAARVPEGAATRAVYSPDVLRDPWFIERQRENVEALEEHCRQTGEMCAEARQARGAIEDR